jgi:hypothetical protein
VIDVGLVGLVELDEPLRQRDPRLASLARSRASRIRSCRSCSWMRDSSARLASRSDLDRDLLALQHGDVALQRADALAVARDRAREDALAPLLGLDQPLLPVDLRADRGRLRLHRAVGEHGQRRPQDERNHCHRDEEAEPGAHPGAPV